MTCSSEDNEKILRMVEEGFSLTDISEETGIGYDAVRARLRRLGMRATHESAKTILQRAEEMPPVAARDYLMTVLHLLFEAQVTHVAHEVDSWDLEMTKMQRAILIHLVDRCDHVVLTRALCALVESMTDKDVDSGKLVNVHIYRVRKVLPSARGRIKNVWGVGYTFVPADSTEDIV